MRKISTSHIIPVMTSAANRKRITRSNVIGREVDINVMILQL